MINIQVTQKSGLMTGRFQAHHYEVIRDLPGRKKWDNGRLYFELNPAVVRYIKEFIPEAQWSDPAPLQSVEQVETQIKETLEQKMQELPKEAFFFEYKTKPYAHQEKGFFLSRDKPEFAIFAEMGTGKTKIAIDTAAYLFAQDRIDSVLIVAPNGVHRQWIEEQIPVHLPDWCEHEKIFYVSPSNQRKSFKKDFDTMHQANTQGKLRILAMHVDAFAHKSGVETAYAFLTTGRCLWIIDESVRIKSPKAQRTKSVLKLSHLAKYKRIMSGAPVTQGVQDLYTQFKFLNPDILGFSSYTAFRNAFCHVAPVPGAPFGVVKITGYKNIDQLQKVIDGFSYRVTKKDCLDLPDKIYMTRQVELTDEQRKAYDQMKKDLVAQLEGGQLTDAPSALVQLMRLQQILCGFVMDVDGNKVLLKNNRVQAAIEACQEAQGKVLIWARFHADLDALGAALAEEGIGFVEYSGRKSDKEKKASKEAFITDPEIQVMLGNQQAGGTGLDGLQAVCNTAIYYSNDFSADARWQSEDRIHRIGQGYHATYVDLVAPDTLDTRIMKALRGKKNVADTVLDVRDLLQSA